MDTAPLANYLGFLALISYILTLIPSNLKIIVPQVRKNKKFKFLLKKRRQIGILSFVFAAIHAYLLIKKRNFDFYDLQTYSIYIQGLVAFIIFTLLAVTSNNWSIKKLKKNWKKLHSLTYIAMFFITWHV